MSPSRDFLIRQAALNVVYREFTILCTAKNCGPAYTLGIFVRGDEVPGWLVNDVRAEFSRLAAVYEVAA